MPNVELFTDGACSGNPGPGGWAFILRHPDSGKENESSGGDPFLILRAFCGESLCSLTSCRRHRSNGSAVLLTCLDG